MEMELKKYRGEPCRAGNFPDEVLMANGFNIPMCVALTLDKKTLLLMDSVDYYQTRDLNKTQALELAEQFKKIAEAME